MRNGADKRDLIIVDGMSGMTRWAPLAVVLGVVGGFVSLSWYAYHAGMQSVREEDLVIVEADRSPMKEKPDDPGGMHFPNQDKTVFDTFASNSKQPPKVERVLPAPEEPLSKEVDSSDTSTFINSKLQHKIADKADAKDARPQELQAAKAPPATDRQVISAQPQHEDESVTYVAPNRQGSPLSPVPDGKVKVRAAATDKRGQPFAPEKAEGDDAKPVARETVKVAAADNSGDNAPKDSVDTAPESMPSAGGNAMIQLGAYRSEQEASDAWKKMHLSQKELSDKKPLIVRADLGAKGVYYRLRVAGLAPAEAKSMCSSLSAKGQACIVAR